MKHRAELLREAVELTKGHIDERLVREVESWLKTAFGRLGVAGEHTVVALAGATGSGKSSTYNRLAGLDLASVGVRRPTTSWALACVWGTQPADEVLAWLEIPARHQVMRGGSLAGLPIDDELNGLILLDLPDHDSTEVAHHIEMSRLVAASDVIIWVLDPQKYADTAIHDGYFRPLADHQDQMIVCLNHIDEVPEDRRDAIIADLRHLLEEDGMANVPLLATSAIRGDGMTRLKSMIAERVSAKQATTDKLNADMTSFALRIQEQNGAASPGDIARASLVRLVRALEEAAGSPVLVRAVQQSRRYYTGRRVGWPFVSWIGRFLPDLNARLGAGTKKEPRPVPVERARVDAAVRQTADEIGSRLPAPWGREARRKVEEVLPRVSDDLDRALRDQHFDTARVGAGWRFLQAVQILLAITLVGGGAWWALESLGNLPSTDFHGFPYGALVAVGAAALGIALALLMVGVVRVRAARFAQDCSVTLAGAVERVARLWVIDPIDEVIGTYRRSRELLLELVEQA